MGCLYSKAQKKSISPYASYNKEKSEVWIQGSSLPTELTISRQSTLKLEEPTTPPPSPPARLAAAAAAVAAHVNQSHQKRELQEEVVQDVLAEAVYKKDRGGEENRLAQNLTTSLVNQNYGLDVTISGCRNIS